MVGTKRRRRRREDVLVTGEPAARVEYAGWARGALGALGFERVSPFFFSEEAECSSI